MHAPNFSFVAKPSMLLCHFIHLCPCFAGGGFKSETMSLTLQKTPRFINCSDSKFSFQLSIYNFSLGLICNIIQSFTQVVKGFVNAAIFYNEF